MFPLFANLPFIKKDGSRTTLGDAISQGGGSYTLPTASDSTKGGVKIGSGLKMTGEVLSADLPIASDDTLGGVKVGSGLSINEDGVLSASGGSGGGSRLYYKDFNSLSFSTFDGNMGSTGFRYGVTSSIDVSGYTPIGVRYDPNTAYPSFPSVNVVYKNSHYYLGVVMFHQETAISARVYYVADDDLDAIST